MQKLFIALLLLISSINLTHTAISKPSMPEHQESALDIFINHILFTTKWGLTEALTLDFDNNEKHWASDIYEKQEVILKEQKILLVNMRKLIKSSKRLYEKYHIDMQNIYIQLLQAKTQYITYQGAKNIYLVSGIQNIRNILGDIKFIIQDNNFNQTHIQTLQIIANKINKLQALHLDEIVLHILQCEYIAVLLFMNPSHSLYLELKQIILNTNIDARILCSFFLRYSNPTYINDIFINTLLIHPNFEPNLFLYSFSLPTGRQVISTLECLIIHDNTINSIRAIINHPKFHSFCTTITQSSFIRTYNVSLSFFNNSFYSIPRNIVINCNIIDRAIILAQQHERHDIVELLTQFKKSPICF